jgi:hypothetical protein
MKRGKFLAAMLGIAGAGMLALGMSSTSAFAQAYASCAPVNDYASGYGYPYQSAPPPVAYYPPAYYAPPPVYVGPTFGIGFGFGGGWHGGGWHGGGWHGGGWHGGGGGWQGGHRH